MRSLVWLRSVLLAFVLVVASGPVARAQSSDAAARAHYERGVALYDEGQFTGALAEFEAAYDASHRASILFNIGQIHARLGRAVDAVASLERYLSEAGSSVSPERRALVEGEIRTQSARIATVNVSVSVPGALVTFDDVDVGQAPLAEAIRTAAGEHVIVARADGFEPARFRFRIAGGESRLVALELLPHAEGAARLRLVIGVPGADVRVDGRSIGLSPIELPIGLPEGQHRIEVTRPGYEPIERTVTLPPSGEETLQFDLVRAASAAPGVVTRLTLALPSTSHTIRVDGAEVPPGTAALELPYGLHDLQIEGEDMVPVRQRIDVPQGPTFSFDTQYQWAPAHRESLRAQASSVRTASAITMIVGGVLALGGGAMLIGRELFRNDQRLQQRVDTAGDCQRAATVMACEDLILMRFGPEMDDMAFFDRTNQLLSTSEGLSIASAVLIGAGSAAVITGLIVFFLPPSDEQIDASTTTRTSVSLDVGPGGLSLRGTF
jgi:hypothetical protein